MNENLRQNTVLMNASLFKFNSLRVGGKLYYISLRSQEEKSGLQQLVARQNVARRDWDGDVTWRRLCSLMQWRRYSACPSAERVATAPLERFSSIIRAHLLVVGCWAGVNSSDVYPSHCFFFLEALFPGVTCLLFSLELWNWCHREAWTRKKE